ncbi:MAG TPA: ABC transporter ATP-binding protein [Candidatus Binatia bacterium]|jgi:putative ABC transport system ATP-binding protein
MAGQDGLFSSGGAEIEVSGLTKVYKTGDIEALVLRGLDLGVAAGQAVAVMGPSGCGKTTFFNLLGGVDVPSGGEIRLKEPKGPTIINSLSERELEQYRLKKTGYIFQLFNLIPILTAEENVALPLMIAGVSAAERKERARALLELVGLKDKAGKRPDEMSGGEQQRVAIAVALANDPPLLLADEPTGNLDSKNTIVVTDLLVSLAERYGKTVLMATHDSKVADKVHKVYHMEDGRLNGG